MDGLLRRTERRVRVAPGDLACALEQARALTRSGRADAARVALRQRLLDRRLEDPVLDALAEGDPLPPRAPPPRLGWLAAAGRRASWRRDVAREVVPTVAFAGPAQPWRAALELARVVAGRTSPGEDALRSARRCRAHGEVQLSFELLLREPWPAAPWVRVGALRVVTLPAAPGAAKLRRALLRSTSALVLVSAPRLGPEPHEELAWTLDRECRLAQGAALAGLPLRLLHGAAEARAGGWPEALAALPVTVAEPGGLGEAALEAAALSLRALRAGLQGLVRPRGAAGS